MKSFNQYNDNEEYLIEGINIRSVSALALVAKSNNLNKNIQSINSNNSELDRKLNLLSKQILYGSILTAQLGIMNKRK
jgi:hypothetical protein